MLKRLAKFKGWGIETEFREKLDQIETKAEQAHLPAPTEAKALPAPVTSMELPPEYQIVHAWKRIEKAVAETFPQYSPRSPSDTRDFLASEGILDSQSLSVLDDLRVLRNRIVHAVNVNLSLSDVMRYSELASRLETKIRASGKS